MPVIIVGADTAIGRSILPPLREEVAELRVFVTDPGFAESLEVPGVKVAVGDVSDTIRVGDAAHMAFCAILVEEALADGRERSFADGTEEIIRGWADALKTSGITRAIWVGNRASNPSPVEEAVAEFAIVATEDREPEAVVDEVLALEAAVAVPLPPG